MKRGLAVCRRVLRQVGSVLLLAAPLGGCVGVVDGGAGTSPPANMNPDPRTNDPRGSGGGNAGNGGTTGSMTSPSDPPPPPPGACGAPAVATMLTREQYINTVSDLFGFDARPMVKFSDAAGRKARPDVRVSALQAEGFLASAVDIANQATAAANLKKILPCDPAKADGACADAFIDGFAARALRRPMSPTLRGKLRALFDQGQMESAGPAADKFAAGIRWVIDGLLQTPDFLYRLVVPTSAGKPGDVVALGDFEIAERLSYFLWNSAPDEALWAAAKDGKLRGEAEMAAQVDRMRKDAKAARAREDFYRALFNLDLLGGILRDDPAFVPALTASLEKSLLAGVGAIYAEAGTTDALLSTSTIFADGTMAKLYGVTGSGTAFIPAAADRNQRRGLLTHPALMTILGEHDTSDPIKRGTFVYKRLLCQGVADPPDDVPELPPLAENLTTRERLVAHRAAPACTACHALFDPIGLAFENFDQLGRFRASEHGAKVDSSGEITQGDLDIKGSFSDGFQLFDRLATSKDVRGCLATQWYEYGASRDVVAADHCALDGIKQRFLASGDLNQLMASIALADTFRQRLVTED